MKLFLFLDLIFLIMLGYLYYHFFQLLIKMRQQIIYPVTEEELSAIRKHPEKMQREVSFSKQKVGIIAYFSMLLFVTVILILGMYFDIYTFPFYVVLLVTIFNSANFINLFAVTEDGILSGTRFVPWKSIKSFRFVLIDKNHKFYGYSKEANNGYELRMKTKLFPINCVVTTEEMKEKLEQLLNEHVKVS